MVHYEKLNSFFASIIFGTMDHKYRAIILVQQELIETREVSTVPESSENRVKSLLRCPGPMTWVESSKIIMYLKPNVSGDVWCVCEHCYALGCIEKMGLDKSRLTRSNTLTNVSCDCWVKHDVISKRCGCFPALMDFGMHPTHKCVQCHITLGNTDNYCKYCAFLKMCCPCGASLNKN
jgi:hypothetical protein